YRVILSDKKKALRTLGYLIVFSLVVLGMHAFWLLPNFLVRSIRRPPETSSLYWPVILSGDNILDAMLLRYDIFWKSDIFTSLSVNFSIFWIIIPILAFTPLFSLQSMKEQDKANLIFLAIASLVSTFLVKGTRAPLGDIYIWMYAYVPYFRGWRVPMEFLPLSLLMISPLFGFSISITCRKLLKITQITPLNFFFRTCLLVAVFLSLITPYYQLITYNFQFNTTLVAHELPKGYIELMNWIQKNDELTKYRIFPISTWGGVLINDEIKQCILASGPWGSGSGNQFISSYATFVRYSVLNNLTFSMGKLIGLVGVKYIIPYTPAIHDYVYGAFPPPYLNPDADIRALESQNDLKRINIANDLWVYESDYACPKFFVPHKVALVVGKRNALLDLSSLGINFEQVGIFFSEQLNEYNYSLLDLLDNINVVIFFNSSISELVNSFFSKSNKTGPYKQDLLIQKLREKESIIIIVPNKENVYQVYIPKSGIYLLSVLIKESILPIKVIYTINQSLIYGTNPVKAYFHHAGWYNISFVFSGNYQIDRIVLSSGESLKDLSMPLNEQWTINWKRVSPTAYLVEVGNLSSGLLVFNEGYDPLWVAKTDGSSFYSVPAYSVLNSFFYNTTSGKILVEYQPQLYVNIGFLFSLFTFMVSISYVVFPILNQVGNWSYCKMKLMRQDVIKFLTSYFIS
ncbi:MAG: hypothetical protein ACP5HX_10390, partial [Thermoproteota archaeon]